MNNIKKYFEHPAFSGVFLAFLCLATYILTLSSEFKIDDYTYIDPALHHSYTGLWNLFTSTTNQHYNPFDILINETLFKVFGRNVIPFHIFDLGLFYINILLLNTIAIRLTKNPKTSLIIAVLFCLHPINAEIVNQIVFSSILFSAGLLMASVLFFDRYLLKKEIGSLFLSCLCALISFGTIETTWLLTFYLFIWAVFFRSIDIKKALIVISPFLLMTVAFCGAWFSMSYTFYAHTGILVKLAYFNSSFLSLAGSWAYLFLWYIAKLFVPIDHIWIYGIDPLGHAQSFYSLAVVIVLLLAVYAFRKKIFPTRVHMMLGLWFLSGFVFLFPGSLGHPEVGLIVEPYWFYVSSAGFFILAGLLISQMEEKIGRSFYNVFLLLLCGILFGLTTRFNIIAQTEQSYCQYWLKICLNPVPLTAIAKNSYQNRDFPKTLHYYELYLSKFSYSPYAVYEPKDIYVSLAGVYSEMGQQQKAKDLIIRALAIDPKLARAYSIKASIEVREKDYPAAEKDFLRTIELNPQNLIAKTNLSDLYLIMDEPAKAIPFLRELTTSEIKGVDRITVFSKLAALQLLYEDRSRSDATIVKLLQIDPGCSTFLMLAQAFESFHKPDEAQRILEVGLQNYPRNKDLYILAGSILGNQGKLTRAVEIWQKGVQLFPDEKRFNDLILEARSLLKKGNP